MILVCYFSATVALCAVLKMEDPISERSCRESHERSQKFNISYSSGRSSLNILQSSFPLSEGSNQLKQLKCDECTNPHLIMGKKTLVFDTRKLPNLFPCRSASSFHELLIPSNNSLCIVAE